MFINAGSLVGTTAITAVLGFVYWWLAARQFPPETVGFASAAISAMMLLGSICILGLGTLLIGELPRHTNKEMPLISAALLLVGAVGGCAGIIFAVVIPFISADFQPLRASIQDVLLFAAGVSLTAITLVLDQALIGMLRGDLQLWRNTLFAIIKLVALIMVGLWLSHTVGLTIYTTWTIGNAVSLVALAAFVFLKKGWSGRNYLPHWGLLRKLRAAAIQHHILNLILQAPALALPILVTIMLSVKANAWFYVAWTITSFVSVATRSLTTVLYAISSAERDTLPHKARLVLGLALVTCLLANCVLQLGSSQILELFGHTYAEEASWSLRILSLAAFPFIIKSLYIAICRVQNRLVGTMLPLAAYGLLELTCVAIGGHLAGLLGLSLGWLIALCIEVIFMFSTVYKVIRSTGTSKDTSIQTVLEPDYAEEKLVTSAVSKRQD
ncbi:MAG: hypothetical protein NVS4B7_03560 [Ktedonobacteraceae bacterium]